MKFIQPNWAAPACVKAYTTLRQDNDYTLPSLQTAPELGMPNEPVWLTQKHTNVVVEATPAQLKTIADASYTTHPERICAVLTADCLPILLCNKQGTQVAAIHGGWRGLASGIIKNTLDALQLPPQDTLVWLGPAISQAKFEVGADVYDAFVANNAAAQQAFKPHAAGKWLANLYLLATMQLNAYGITNIYGGDYCTYSQADLFYSYRREKEQAGRMVSLIWISAN